MAAWQSNFGAVLAELGDLTGARTHYERALAIGQATLGPDHPKVTIYRRNLGDVVQHWVVGSAECFHSSLDDTGAVRGC